MQPVSPTPTFFPPLPPQGVTTVLKHGNLPGPTSDRRAPHDLSWPVGDLDRWANPLFLMGKMTWNLLNPMHGLYMWTPKQNHETYQTDSTTERTDCVEFDFQYKDVTSLNPAMTVYFSESKFWGRRYNVTLEHLHWAWVRLRNIFDIDSSNSRETDGGFRFSHHIP